MRKETQMSNVTNTGRWQHSLGLAGALYVPDAGQLQPVDENGPMVLLRAVTEPEQGEGRGLL